MNFSNKNNQLPNTNIMRKSILNIGLISFFLLATHLINAQSVQSGFINYQGIARDGSDEILANQALSIEISLRFGAPDIAPQYTETHNVTTDAGGVFSLKIGDGTASLGDYYDLQWDVLASYVTVSLNGNELGTTEMHAVPFALSSGDRTWYKSFDSDDIFYDYGKVGIGTSEPEEDLHIEGNVLIDSGEGHLAIGFPENGNQWRFGSIGGGENLLFSSKPAGSSNQTNRFTFSQEGHLAISSTNFSPDEELVIGENLGTGWAIPAATIGNSVGGAIEVGNPTTSFKVSSSSTFNRTRMIASDENGNGEGIIEMRTRQLNIGTEPGVGASPYAVRIVQASAFGLDLVSTDETQDWELVAFNSGNLTLYNNGASKGTFDPVSGNYNATSDKHLKTNINDTESVIEKVNQLKAKSYNYKTNPSKTYTGFLAQELRELFPNVVTESVARNENESNTLMVDYNQLTVIALQAIKEQQQTIEALKARIEVLENN